MERSNPWWRSEPDAFLEEKWSKLKVKWIPKEKNRLSLEPFSLNFLYGPRQVGKTTLVKLLIEEILHEKKQVDSRSVLYFACDELADYKELGEVLASYLGARSSWGIKTSYIFLDEVTFVEDWWRALKARIDDGSLSHDTVTVSGSASLDLLRHREHFPGRRGNGKDLLLRPLGFRSYVNALTDLKLQLGDSLEGSNQAINANQIYSETLSSMFQSYTETGGYPLAIHDNAGTGRVSEATRKALVDGLRGDLLRVGRSEKYMKEVISYIISARANPISWLGISKETSIKSPNTTRTYVETLDDLLVLTILELIRPDGKVMHRKNRKIHFSDPFVHSALAGYVGAEMDEAALVEGTVASHLSRHYDTYFWRNGSEVDIIARNQSKAQYGVEVKWGFKSGRKPRHLRQYFSLNRSTLPVFLASLSFT